MHALASHLKTTVAAIERGMTAAEFNAWCLWMDAERVGPMWDRIRHAQLQAAIYQGASEREGGGNFTVQDFLPPDPFAEPAQEDPEAVAERLRQGFAAMNWAATKTMQ